MNVVVAPFDERYDCDDCGRRGGIGRRGRVFTATCCGWTLPADCVDRWGGAARPNDRGRGALRRAAGLVPDEEYFETYFAGRGAET
jgi:hypothetical protein